MVPGEGHKCSGCRRMASVDSVLGAAVVDAKLVAWWLVGQLVKWLANDVHWLPSLCEAGRLLLLNLHHPFTLTGGRPLYRAHPREEAAAEPAGGSREEGGR